MKKTQLIGAALILVFVPTEAALAAIVPKPGHWNGFTTPRGGKDDEALFIAKGLQR